MGMTTTTPITKAETEALNRLQKNPIEHIVDIQGVGTLQPYQGRILQSVAKYDRTVVASSHDLGKTWTASKLILWFTSTFPKSKVITTAPTFKQVRTLLWSEIRSGFSNSKVPLGGTINLTEWSLGTDWFAIGYTSQGGGDTSGGQGQASSFQGYHAPYILVVFDEATGIVPGIWVQAEGLLTSGFVRFLAIGNPTTRSCEFYRCFSDPAYNKIYLSCFDSPNFPANGFHSKADLAKELDHLKAMNQSEQTEALHRYRIVNTHLLTVQWVMRMVLKWGITHPLVVSKCFGEFPEDGESTLIPLGVVEASQRRGFAVTPQQRVSIGVDVARFGGDKTIIALLQGGQQTGRKVLLKRDSSEIAGEVVRTILDLGPQARDVHVVIDATGIGSGVVDILNEKQREKVLHERVEIRECHFGSGPDTHEVSERESEELKKKYVNLKARIFVELSEDLKTGSVALMEEDVYLEELPTIQYRFDSKGRWFIESKEEYKKRTGRDSPDDSDALALANYGRKDAGVGNFPVETKRESSRNVTGIGLRSTHW